MVRSQIENDQARDSDFAYQSELDQVKDNNEEPPEFVAATMNNWELFKRISQIGNLANDFNFSFFNPAANKDYVEVNSSSYVLVATFIYRGTGIWTPATVLAGLSRKAGAGTSYLRIYDADNNEVILEHQFTAVARTLYEITSLSNLPTENAFFEVQLRTTSAAGASRLHALGLYPEQA